MTTTVVLPDVPLPIRSGTHLRDWQQLQLLKALGHSVKLISFVPSHRHPNPEQLQQLKGMVEEIILLPLGTSVENPSGIAKGWRHLATLWPWHPGRMRRYGYLKGRYPFGWAYDAVDGGEQVASWIRRWRPEAVVLRSRLLHLLPLLTRLKCRVVVDAPDVHAWIIWEYSRSDPRLAFKILLKAQALALLRYEALYTPGCDEIWATSPPEAKVFRRLAQGRARVVALPNLVHLQRYPVFSTGSSRDILLVANFGLSPNAEAAARLIREIFPRVKRRLADARLWLVGAGMPARLKEQARRIGSVETPGVVPDVHPYMEKAAVVAIPLRGVGGVPYKLIEAMAQGKAIVTTSRTIAGISARPGTHLLVADRACDFAEAVVHLLSHPAERARLGAAARTLVEEEYSYEAGTRILRRDSKIFGRAREQLLCAS